MNAFLIFPHQLFKDIEHLENVGEVYLIEEHLFFRQFAFHKQKLVLHRASMQAYAEELREREHKVAIIAHTEDFRDVIPKQLKEIHIADPHDFILEKRLDAFAKARGVSIHIYPSPTFLSQPEFLEEHIARRKKPFMASFYQAQRKRMRILIDADGNPTGGQWSFDEDNRKKLPKDIELPESIAFLEKEEINLAAQWAGDTPAEKYGEPGCWLPYSHETAEIYMNDFLQNRFASFGTYEDAMSTESRGLFHTRLASLLNLHRVMPHQAAEMALESTAELNNVEGFLRQLIWREYVHHVHEVTDGFRNR